MCLQGRADKVKIWGKSTTDYKVSVHSEHELFMKRSTSLEPQVFQITSCYTQFYSTLNHMSSVDIIYEILPRSACKREPEPHFTIPAQTLQLNVPGLTMVMVHQKLLYPLTLWRRMSLKYGQYSSWCMPICPYSVDNIMRVHKQHENTNYAAVKTFQF